MPNYGDFNFGDDNPDVDTDPFFDKLFSSPHDNVQDDVLNFREPGENGIAEGQQVTDFDTNSNPEEPGAQQDHIPPVVTWGMLSNIFLYGHIHDPEEGEEIIDRFPYVENPWTMLENMFLYGHPHNPEEGERKINYFPYNKTPWSMLENIFLYGHTHDPEEGESIVDRNPYNETPWTMLENIFLYDHPYNAEEGEGTINYFPYMEVRKSMLENMLLYGHPHDPEDSLELVTEAILDDQPDPSFASAIDAFGISLVEQFNKSDSFDDTIPGSDDDANSQDDPTGIGQFFDKLVVAGFDEDILAEDDDLEAYFAKLFEDERIAPTADDFFNQLFLEEFDVLNLNDFSDTINLMDYVGDVTNESDVIEFQNMTNSSLENWDGLL